MADVKDTTGITEDNEVVTSSVEAPVRSPRTHVDSSPLPTDSMVTVPLSEAGTAPDEDEPRDSVLRPEIVVDERRDSSRPSSSEILKAFGRRSSSPLSIEIPTGDSPTVSVDNNDIPETPETAISSRRGSGGSGKSQQVDWEELERKEEQEPEGEGQDQVSSMA